MRLREPGEPVRDRFAEVVRLERDGTAVLPKDPACEQLHVRVARLEDAVLDRSRVRERALDPPRGVVGHGDPRGADRLADLPRSRDAVLLDVELRWHAEVTLPPGCEADVALDPRDLEGAHGVAVEVVPNDVPVAVVEAKRVRVERPVAGPRATRAPVAELHRPLLRDRGLELRQPSCELRRVVRGADPHPLGGLCRRLGEPRAPEREVLEREAERLRVGELALEVVEGRLQRSELLVVQLEAVEEVVLRAEGVELLARELVALGLQRDAEPRELGPIRVEASREGLVRHLAVALDVRLDVARGQRAPLGHEEGDQ